MKKILIIALGMVFAFFLLTACSEKGMDNAPTTKEEVLYGEFQWPKSNIAKLLPIPESNIGRISWENSYGFVIDVGETSNEQYDAYVDECWEKGFTIDYNKGNDYFWANNEYGYKVTVRYYKDTNTMWIRIDEPDEPKESADDSVSAKPILQIDWTKESFYELSFDVSADWRKGEQNDSGVYFYPTNNDLDGFLYVGIRGFAENVSNDFEVKKEAMHSLVEYKNSEDFVRHDFIEYNLEIAGKYSVKSYSTWKDYDCLYYYILSDIGVYLIGIDIYENSSENLEEILDRVMNSITIIKESNERNNNETDSIFSPQDVSDETIKSIQTYSDYLEMYRKIIDDYLANYEAVIKGTILYSEEAFANMKQQSNEAFESQKTMYESFGNTKLIGKDTLVEFLMSYRDSLKEYTDSLAENLKSFS